MTGVTAPWHGDSAPSWWPQCTGADSATPPHTRHPQQTCKQCLIICRHVSNVQVKWLILSLCNVSALRLFKVFSPVKQGVIFEVKKHKQLYHSLIWKEKVVVDTFSEYYCVFIKVLMSRLRKPNYIPVIVHHLHHSIIYFLQSACFMAS